MEKDKLSLNFAMKYREDKITEVSEHLIKHSKSKTLCFYGEMGAGKTTLIKALVNTMGGADSASSPTFGIVNEYHFKSGEVLGYHFDFYRLNDETEALDLGFEDYLNQDKWIFIEWPEKIPSFIPNDAQSIYIKIIDQATREIVIS